MADLTQDKDRKSRGVWRRGSAVIATGTTYYVGSVLAFNSSGLLVKASDTSGLRIAGVATKGTVTAAGVPGASVAGARGEFEFDGEEFFAEGAGTFAGSMVGLDASMLDDSSVQTAAEGTNDIRVGRITERETIEGVAGSWVHIARHGLAAA